MTNEVIQVAGKSYKKVKVVMLPTEKASKIFKHIRNWRGEPIYPAKIVFSDNETYIRNIHLIDSGKAATNAQDKYEFYNLYFLSDETPKEGDWVYNLVDKCISRILREQRAVCKTDKKIIVTTDESLLVTAGKDENFGVTKSKSLPRPSNEFLQAYCKADGKIKEVLVEVEGFHPSSSVFEGYLADTWEYKLKVSPDNTITIKPVKDSWSRQEVISLFKKYEKENSVVVSMRLGSKLDLTEWISENL